MTAIPEAKPRPRLSQDGIVDALLALARESPSAEVSFRTLGTALDVNATAVYRHFRDKDELYRAAVDRLYTEALARVDRSNPSWREQLLQYADALAESFVEAPAIGQLAPLIDGRGYGELASIDFVLEAFDGIGLEPKAAVSAYGAYSASMLALAAGMARERAREFGREVDRGGHEAGASIAAGTPWIKALDSNSLAHFPRVVERQAELLALDTFEVYRASMRAVLDSVAPA